MALSFVTSGQSHGPGIVAVVSGLPAGLEPDRERLRRDLGRRLEAAKATAPLFDTAAFTRALETLYLKSCGISTAG